MIHDNILIGTAHCEFSHKCIGHGSIVLETSKSNRALIA